MQREVPVDDPMCRARVRASGPERVKTDQLQVPRAGLVWRATGRQRQVHLARAGGIEQLLAPRETGPKAVDVIAAQVVAHERPAEQARDAAP